MTSIHDPADPVHDPASIEHDREFDQNVDQNVDHDRDLEVPTPPPAGRGVPPIGTQKQKRRGRPSKPRVCSRCQQEKLSSEFRYGSTYCKACGHEAQLAYLHEQKTKRQLYKDADLAGRAHLSPKRTEALQAIMKERSALAEFKQAFAQFTLPTCSCCFDVRDVTADPVGGTPFCPICLFQIVRCGRCATHASRDFYPHLSSGPVVDVPAELLHAYGLKTASELSEAVLTVSVAPTTEDS